MTSLVRSEQIVAASLHTPLHPLLHTYNWPFAVVWPVFVACYLNEDIYDDYIDGSEWTSLYVGIIASCQILVWLMTKWDINLKARFTTTSVRSVAAASLIKILPAPNAGSADICEIVRERSPDTGETNTFFIFQKLKFLYDESERTFFPLTFSIDADDKPMIGIFKNSTGLASDTEIQALQNRYGDNRFEIPVPSFIDLFKEHAVAPLFVFQVACVGLWMMDDYWYSSLFSLVMLLVFESTIVLQRRTTLTEFQAMSIPPYGMFVYRKRKWVKLTSDKLLPGDLVSVTRAEKDQGLACDLILVQGSLIANEAMLTGESTPVRKDSLTLRPDDEKIDPEGLDKASFLYGGTKIMQILKLDEDESGPTNSSVPSAPDNGALAVVVKTGFETSQGSLLRTMIFTSESSKTDTEALYFILLLLVFAIAASWYVWEHGVQQDRKRAKLLLDCVLIITSVVPPELPLQLSLAVNTSLIALGRNRIFCTEPFRIPFAGRVDVACFDKTGTLTGEDLVVDGVICPDQNWEKPPHKVAPANITTAPTILVMATAHALARLDNNETVGEPMEQATVASVQWKLGTQNRMEKLGDSRAPFKDVGGNMPKAQSDGGLPKFATIKRQFPFSSKLKRQSSISILHSQSGPRSTFVAVKGAPETIWKMINPPCSRHAYESHYKPYAREGGRVLAMAFKFLSTGSELSMDQINSYSRDDIESGLTFAGFLILKTRLKNDAVVQIQMLNRSSHRCVMITGDNPLTAVNVARQVEIIDRDCKIFDQAPDHDDIPDSVCSSKEEKELILSSKVVVRNIDDTEFIPVDPASPLDSNLLKNHDLCITGAAMEHLQDGPAWNQILRHTWIYARVSPKQKEAIILGLRNLGYITLMCGDGTNDVGALKQAHVGVALLNGDSNDLRRIDEKKNMDRIQALYEKQAGLMKQFNQPAPPVPRPIAHRYPKAKNNPFHDEAVARELASRQAGKDNSSSAVTVAAPAPTSQKTKSGLTDANAGSIMERLQASLEQDMDADPPMVRPGDASCAAPFTSQLADVSAIPNIIRQGRCTLVATIQMYKILALNCLITAYSLSVLYLDGIQFGDGQRMISGIMMSACFLSISRARSAEQLSKERPQNNIFNLYIMGSIMGQFAVHIASLIFISRYVQRTEPIGFVDVDLEPEFEPSLMNSAIYLLQLIQQISTFAINYQGRPFRESIRENNGMFWSLTGVAGIAFACSTELVPQLNQQLGLVPFSGEFQFLMTTTMALDYGVCWAIENGLKSLFSDYKPKDIAIRRPDQEARDIKLSVSTKAGGLADSTLVK